MALTFLHPEPGARIKVIGAGLPRTGTTSFCAALSVLLKAPAYHAGVQYGAGSPSETHILTMMEAARGFPYSDPEHKRHVYRKLENILDGYAATADSPLIQLVPELMEIYPDAKVICTVRDRHTWAKSVLLMAQASQPRLAKFIFFWIPSLRYLPEFAEALTHIWSIRYGQGITSEEGALKIWGRHLEYLEDVVPKEKLFYYTVKDGWGPLCEILELPIPDEPFPRLNDAKDFQVMFQKLALQGLLRWVMVFSGIIVAIVFAYWISSGGQR
ncbi:hypothetical protein N0V93_004006 [Gnomoniopsis smithogilvyi]|uniref:NAD dependent epimerase/dehydratase n=1 Tax=Gnomoniopsis smithogilvyi TaxID=1191159 RepID=A0A9W8YZS2_9PEZI|nr:hypothetical protein N0V93_004006 [Gnomoniopsis smithogilvyi]